MNEITLYIGITASVLLCFIAFTLALLGFIAYFRTKKNKFIWLAGAYMLFLAQGIYILLLSLLNLALPVDIEYILIDLAIALLFYFAMLK